MPALDAPCSGLTDIPHGYRVHLDLADREKESSDGKEQA
jgi:hypothetical protein